MSQRDPIELGIGEDQAPWGQLVNVTVCCALLTALGAAFGVMRGTTISEVENRRLAVMPTLTFAALYDGSYTRGVELFIADHFPFRERFVSVAFWLRERRGLKVESTVFEVHSGGLEEAESWAAHHDGGADDGGLLPGEELAPEETGLPELTAAEPLGGDGGEAAGDGSDGGAAGDGEGGALEEPAGPLVEEEPDPELDGGAVKVAEGILSFRGRAMMLFKGTDDTAQLFVKTVQAYRRTLSSRATVHVVVVPTAAAFYLPADQQEKSRPQRENLQVMRQALDGGVDFVDVYAALEPHQAESIYYRTDHHWTSLGAYYGYSAFCRGAGLFPVPLSWLVRKERPGSLGSLYRMTHDETLTEEPEVYYEPAVKSEAVRYSGEEQTRAVRARAIDADAGGYLLFMGGDWGLWAGRPKAQSPRRALVVKNSFGNAFVPYLLPHFDRVVAMDYRYTIRSVEELVLQYHITDVVLVMDTITANDDRHRRRVREVLSGHDAAWAAVKAKPKDGGVR